MNAFVGLANKRAAEAAWPLLCLTLSRASVTRQHCSVSFLVEEKASTHLLLGMCLDTYARYLLFSKQPSQAQRMYEKALQISEEMLGERHPQVREESRERSWETKRSEFPAVRCHTHWGRISADGPGCFPSARPPPAACFRQDLRGACGLGRACDS